MQRSPNIFTAYYIFVSRANCLAPPTRSERTVARSDLRIKWGMAPPYSIESRGVLRFKRLDLRFLEIQSSMPDTTLNHVRSPQGSLPQDDSRVANEFRNFVATDDWMLVGLLGTSARFPRRWFCRDGARNSPAGSILLVRKTLKSGCLSLLTIRSFGACNGLGLSVRVWFRGIG
eukprot:sb/3472014/